MASSDDSSQEKTHEPTARRIHEEQEKGNFARSKDVTTVAGLLSLLLFLWLGQGFMKTQAFGMGRFFLRFDDFLDLSADTAPEFFLTVLAKLATLILPLMLLGFIAALTGEVAQIGFRVVRDAFEPKWDRLNPVSGLKRMFSLTQLVEGAKAIGKLFIYAYVGYITVRGELDGLLSTSDAEVMQGAEFMWRVVLKLGFRTCGLLVAFAGFDYWFQRRQYYKKLRMSHQDIKEEMKRTEGDPVLKQQIRSLQMQIARKRMMQDVPESDVIVTNPTHYAVALKYDPTKSGVPVVTAKGQNYMAFKIRDVALENGVPVVENPPVARLLYRKGEVGRPVPGELYKAVAQILASVWALARKRGRSWATRADSRERQRHTSAAPRLSAPSRS